QADRAVGAHQLRDPAVYDDGQAAEIGTVTGRGDGDLEPAVAGDADEGVATAPRQQRQSEQRAARPPRSHWPTPASKPTCRGLAHSLTCAWINSTWRKAVPPLTNGALPRFTPAGRLHSGRVDSWTHWPTPWS